MRGSKHARGGRPCRIDVALTRDQKAGIRRAADRAGMSDADWVRWLIDAMLRHEPDEAA